MFQSGLFIIYLLLYFLRLHEYNPGTAETSVLFVTLLSCAIVYLFSRDKNIKGIQTTFLFGFFTWAVLSHVSFGYVQGSIDTAYELTKLIILYLISASLFTNFKRLEFYFKFICICALVMALHGIDQVNNGVGWTGMTLSQGTRIRYIGVFQDPNDLGMLFLIVVPFFLYIINKSNSYIIKGIWFAGLLAILYAIYLTNSRGTLIGLMLMLSLYGWYKYNRILTISLMAIIVPAVMVATRLSNISGESSAAGRIDAWTEGFYMLRADPLFGVGHNMFLDHHFRVAHSSYVQTFAETGLIGYFFWLGFLTMPMYALFRFAYKFKLDITNLSSSEIISYQYRKKLAITMIYALLGFAGSALFISRSTQPILFIICGMAAGVISLINKEYPMHGVLKFNDCVKPTIIISVVSIIIIYISIRLFW